MEKVKEIFKNKIFLIVLGVIVVVLLVGGGLFLVFGKEKKSEKDLLLEDLTKMGVAFYEDLYYDQQGQTDEERAEFLAKYKDLGIKVSLNNLIRVNTEEENQEALDKLSEKCDAEETKVVIYPKEPYRKDTYNVELITDHCNFEEE